MAIISGVNIYDSLMFQGLKLMTSVAVPVFDRNNKTVSICKMMLYQFLQSIISNNSDNPGNKYEKTQTHNADLMHTEW